MVGDGSITGETEEGVEEEVEVQVPRRSARGAIAEVAAGAVPGAGVEAGATVPVEDTFAAGRVAPQEATAAAEVPAAAVALATVTTGIRGPKGEVLSREILKLRSSQRWKVLTRKMSQYPHLQLQRNRNCFPWAAVEVALPFLKVTPMGRPRTGLNLILFLQSQSVNQQVESSMSFAP